MKKRMLIVCLALACLLVLTGCCSHKVWNEADCLNPRTCAECGETEGEALGHDWVDADCLNPKTCAECGETEGEPADHTWAEATCDAPKTCAVCAESEGEALGHSWLDATTEDPKTCTVCAATEGERIITDERFTTAEAQPLFGTWEGTVALTGEMIELPDLQGDILMSLTVTFGNDGAYTMETRFADWDAFMGTLGAYTTDMMYSELEAMGLDKAAADAAVEESYGMTMDELIDAMLAEYKEEDMNETTEGVYYVRGGTLHMAGSWNEAMGENDFALNDGKLIIEMDGYGTMEMSPVAE